MYRTCYRPSKQFACSRVGDVTGVSSVGSCLLTKPCVVPSEHGYSYPSPLIELLKNGEPKNWIQMFHIYTYYVSIPEISKEKNLVYSSMSNWQLVLKLYF